MKKNEMDGRNAKEMGNGCRRIEQRTKTRCMEQTAGGIRRTNPGSVNTAISGKENGKDAARKNVITSSRRKTADQEPFIGRMKPETARDARMAGTPPASVTASGKSCWK